MADLTDIIEETAANPKVVKSDGNEVSQHSIKELIEADRHLANKEAAKSKTLPIRMFQTRPPGAV